VSLVSSSQAATFQASRNEFDDVAGVASYDVFALLNDASDGLVDAVEDGNALAICDVGQIGTT
jgi:hypothetical protein